MRILVLLLLTLLLSTGISVTATSWASVPPDEVHERSEVVVLGKYNFDGESTNGKFIFHGQEFTVEYVLKGENISKDLIVGIDMFDVGWVQEFQHEGGRFLMFLQNKPDHGDFLVPVAGPNGMIRVINGEVMEDERHRVHYNKFLKDHTPDYILNDSAPERNMGLFIYILVSCLLLVIGSKLFGKYKLNKA